MLPMLMPQPRCRHGCQQNQNCCTQGRIIAHACHRHARKPSRPHCISRPARCLSSAHPSSPSACACTPRNHVQARVPPQPSLSCVAQTPIPCSARAALDKHSCVQILESMTGISFVSLTRRQRLLLLCIGGRAAFFLNTMFACNETWRRKQRLMYAICLFKAHRARAFPVWFKTHNPQPATLTPPSPACAWPPLRTCSTAKA
jgi:hypothetical protein